MEWLQQTHSTVVSKNRHGFMKFLIFFLVLHLPLFACKPTSMVNEESINQNTQKPIVGAQQFNEYLTRIQGKRVALVVNQTSMVEEGHLVDALLNRNIEVKKVFAPEHGFRGTADAGEKVKSGIDTKTGLPVISLYGNNKKPTAAQLADIDVVLFDIQDVGARFYTYISTLEYVMEACAEQDKKVIVLDRPNPNGHYVDGPVLNLDFQSFVGRQQIPIVHGMTVGEYAKFLNGEQLLANGAHADLEVIPCKQYDHTTPFELPVAPSPNLPNQQSILLYPSLCLFEGTNVSVGRGTNTQFQVYGSPKFAIGSYAFTPTPMPGAKYPKFEGQACYGMNLTNVPDSFFYDEPKLHLGWLIGMVEFHKNAGEPFFLKNNFFDKLAGTDQLRQQLLAGMSEEEIRLSWQDELSAFKQTRKKYLLYQDFE